GLYTSPGSGGSASVTATSGAVSGSAVITVNNATPAIVAAASASPSLVVGASTILSVLAADDGGGSNLTYIWATTGSPPAAVNFSINNSNAAKNTTATFTTAGSYNLLVAISDGTNTTTSSLAVTVNQTLTSIVISPGTATVNENATQ